MNSFYRWNALAVYNSEVARGIVHEPEYAARMAREQKLFDDRVKRESEEQGWIVLEGS